MKRVRRWSNNAGHQDVHICKYMKTQPLVSVLLPVYNAEKYLAEAIQSILDQSYQNFEFLIIDDGSVDRSVDIASTFGQDDQRIRLMRHSINQGLVAALNLGLDLAQGDYIARMDADDISLPDRLERQVEYMETHPETGVLGCNIQYMDENGNLVYLPDFSFHGDLAIRWNLFFINPFSHPAVMMRKSIIDRYKLRYDPRAEHVEDYEYWGRFLHVSKGENLNDILLHYRLHQDSICYHHGGVQNKLAAQISGEIIKRHLPDVNASPQEIAQWTDVMWSVSVLDRRSQVHLVLTHLKIWHAFYRTHRRDPGLIKLRQGVITWASIMILYPFFQPGWIKAIWYLTKVEWLWPYFLLIKLPNIISSRGKINFTYPVLFWC